MIRATAVNGRYLFNVNKGCIMNNYLHYNIYDFNILLYKIKHNLDQTIKNTYIHQGDPYFKSKNNSEELHNVFQFKLLEF